MGCWTLSVICRGLTSSRTLTWKKVPREIRQGCERGPGPVFNWQKKDQKFNFGGKKRAAKSDDAASTADMHGFLALSDEGQELRRY